MADESMEVSLPDIITHYQSRPTGQNEDDDITVDLTGCGEDQGVVVQDKDVAPTPPSLPLTSPITPTSPSPREVPISATTPSTSAPLASVDYYL